MAEITFEARDMHQAIKDAASGKRIVIVAKNSKEAEEIYKWVVGLAKEYYEDNDPWSYEDDTVLKFYRPRGGRLKVVHRHTRLFSVLGETYDRRIGYEDNEVINERVHP